jgi:hypothetical protein
MNLESSDDLTVFFDLDDFGTVAKYAATNKRTVNINGIFDNPSASLTATQNMDVTMPKPTFVCRTADVPNVAEGDFLTIRSKKYTVRVVLDDGVGVTTMMLELV